MAPPYRALIAKAFVSSVPPCWEHFLICVGGGRVCFPSHTVYQLYIQHAQRAYFLDSVYVCVHRFSTGCIFVCVCVRFTADLERSCCSHVLDGWTDRILNTSQERRPPSDIISVHQAPLWWCGQAGRLLRKECPPSFPYRLFFCTRCHVKNIYFWR